MYLGDFPEDSTVKFLWSTNAASGASITRATDGTISVYKDLGTSQTTTGVTDTEDFDSLTGIHACEIDLSSDAFYATGADYDVVLSAATIDGETVNAVLAHFSIENRHNEVTLEDNAITAAKIASDAIDQGAIATDAIGASELAASAINAIADQFWDELMTGHQGAGSFGDQVANVLATPNAIWNYASAIGSALGAALADALLSRGAPNVEDSAEVDSLFALIHSMLHSEVVNGVLKILKSDDTTVFDEKDLGTSATALPIISVKDP